MIVSQGAKPSQSAN